MPRLRAIHVSAALIHDNCDVDFGKGGRGATARTYAPLGSMTARLRTVRGVKPSCSGEPHRRDTDAIPT